MKKKDKVKFVYHEFIDDKSCRRFCRFFQGKNIFLDEEFPYLHNLGCIIFSTSAVVVIRNITFDFGLSSGKAWIDKHGNVIVRIDNIYNQTKINF